MPARSRFCNLALFALAAAALAVARPAVAQTPLQAISGSPFTFYEWGQGSYICLLSADEQQLFVSNGDSDTITVLNVAQDGTLSYGTTVPTSNGRTAWMKPMGMAINPAGDTLYVVGMSWGGPAAVSVLRIWPGGGLEWLKDVDLPYGSLAANGIAYVTQPDGDTVYVNNNVDPNTVSVFKVDPADGTLVSAGEVPTGGSGGLGFYASTSLVTTRPDGGVLYAMNGAYSATGSNNIAAFTVGSDGSLTPVPGSPFALPDNHYTAGCIVADPTGAWLYASTTQPTGGDVIPRIARYAVGADGALTLDAAYPVGMYLYGAIGTLAIRPDGKYLVGAINNYGRLVVLDTAAMRPVRGSSVYCNASYGPDGVLFDKAGKRVFVADRYWATQVSVYKFIEQPAILPLKLSLTVDPVGTVNRFGEAFVGGTLVSTVPMDYWLNIVVRQRVGRTVVSASGGFQVTVGPDGKATWKWKASNPTVAFKSGAVEVIVDTGGTDMVTGEWVPAQATQTVKLGSVR